MRHILRQVDNKFELLLAAQKYTELIRQAMHELLKLEWMPLNIYFSCFYFRKIQYIINDPQQRLRGGIHLVYIILLRWR
ncbi:hypothetical protein D3C78_1530290 [compost metagenome]